MKPLYLFSVTTLIASKWVLADTKPCATNQFTAITPAESQDLRKAILRGYLLPKNQKRNEILYRNPHSVRILDRQAPPEGPVDTSPVLHDDSLIQVPPDNPFTFDLDPTATADIAKIQQASTNGQRRNEISPPAPQGSKTAEMQYNGLGIGLINQKCKVVDGCPTPSQKAYQSDGPLCLLGGDPEATYQQAFKAMQSFTLTAGAWAGALVTQRLLQPGTPSTAPMYINFRVRFPTETAPAYLNHQNRYEPLSTPIGDAAVMQAKRLLAPPDDVPPNIQRRADPDATACEPSSKSDFDSTIFQLWRTVFMPRVERGETTQASFFIAVGDEMGLDGRKMGGPGAAPSGLTVDIWVSEGQADFMGMMGQPSAPPT